MLPASNRGPGMSFGFPDVCATPTPAGPVPTPYPNMAMNAQASPFSQTVKVNMMNALNQMSQIALSSGDEAGSAHPTVKGPQRYTMGSPNVYVDGVPAITLASMTSHNNMNCPVGAVVVPSAVNVTFSLNASAVGGEHPVTDVRATRRLRGEDLASIGRCEPVADTPALRPQEDGRGVVAIHVFTESAGAELHAALERLTAAGATSVEIDLRGCPGGSLEGALDAASVLLAEGAPLAEVVDEDGDVTLHRGRGGAFVTLPIELVVDGDTASAAEVFAAALADHARASVRGGPTYGKGVTHVVRVDASGTPWLASTGRVRSPRGREIDRVGVG
ncbi:MAG TPA: PAAR-like domain-containing protein [Polyangiaceae bacterium]|nr:PAAR-like domain-containing protein [Polyangiaceae bacterium]